MPLSKAILKSNATLVAVEAGQRGSVKPAPASEPVAAVQAIQEALGSLGYLAQMGADWPARGSPSGKYGAGTTSAVIAFQKSAFPGIPSEWDGRVGAKTLRKMDARLGGPVAPGQPAKPGGGGGGLPPPAELETINLKVGIGSGLKVSFQDPLLHTALSPILRQFGVDFPNGADLLFVTMKYLNKLSDGVNPRANGALLGVTPRRNAGKAAGAALGQLLTSHGHKLTPAMLGVLKALESVATSTALAAGVVGAAAQNFDGIKAMHRYTSGASDEVALGLSFGNNAGKLLETFSSAKDWVSLNRSAAEALFELTTRKERYLSAFDIPAMSVGWDVGVSVGATTWYAADFDAILTVLKKGIFGGLFMDKAKQPGSPPPPGFGAPAKPGFGAPVGSGFGAPGSFTRR